jgi:hypothetical protein
VNSLAIVIQRYTDFACWEQPDSQPLYAARVKHHQLGLTFVYKELAPDFAFAIDEPQLFCLDYTVFPYTH